MTVRKILLQAEPAYMLLSRGWCLRGFGHCAALGAGPNGRQPLTVVAAGMASTTERATARDTLDTPGKGGSEQRRQRGHPKRDLNNGFVGGSCLGEPPHDARGGDGPVLPSGSGELPPSTERQWQVPKQNFAVIHGDDPVPIRSRPGPRPALTCAAPHQRAQRGGEHEPAPSDGLEQLRVRLHALSLPPRARRAGIHCFSGRKELGPSVIWTDNDREKPGVPVSQIDYGPQRPILGVQHLKPRPVGETNGLYGYRPTRPLLTAARGLTSKVRFARNRVFERQHPLVSLTCAQGDAGPNH